MSYIKWLAVAAMIDGVVFTIADILAGRYDGQGLLIAVCASLIILGLDAIYDELVRQRRAT